MKPENYKPIQDPDEQRLRRKFAIIAMRGMLGNEMFMHGIQTRVVNQESLPEYIADYSVRLADALIEKLKH